MKSYLIELGLQQPVYANARNGLIWCERNHIRYQGIAYFQSTHAHQSTHYFDRTSMPLDAIYRLLKGENIAVIDCSPRKVVPSALSKGLASWVYALNFAIGFSKEKVPLDNEGFPEYDIVPWSTDAIRKYAWFSKEASYLRRAIRKLRTLVNVPRTIGLRICLPTQGEWHFNPMPERKEMICTNYVYAVVPTKPLDCIWDDSENLRK